MCPQHVCGCHQMEDWTGNMLKGSVVVQGDPARLEEQTKRNFIKFSQDKCSILHLRGNGIPAPGQAKDWLAAEQCSKKKKTTGGPGEQEMYMSRNKYYKIRDCMNRGRASSSLRERVIPAQSALIWLYLDGASNYGFPNKRAVLKSWDVFKRWQPWWWGLEHLTQETREFGLFSLGGQLQYAVSERMASGRGSQALMEPRNHRQASQATVILVFPCIHFLWHTVRVFKSNPLSFVLLSLPKLLTLP